MTAPLDRETTFLILEAGRLIQDDRARDNFYDHVAHELSENLCPCAEDVERAIHIAKQALRKAGAN